MTYKATKFRRAGRTAFGAIAGHKFPLPKLVKLPKQWAHWCRKTGLRPERDVRGCYRWYTLKGCWRHWRVIRHGEFQVSDRYDDFDRWANSVEATYPLPKTYTEFLLRVRFT